MLQEHREEDEVEKGFLEEARFELSLMHLFFPGFLLVNQLAGSVSLDLQYVVQTPGGRQVALQGPPLLRWKTGGSVLPTFIPLSRSKRCRVGSQLSALYPHRGLNPCLPSRL